MMPKRRPPQGWLVELNQKVKISQEHILQQLFTKVLFFFEWRSRSSLNMSKGKWSRFLPVSLTPEYRRRRCNGRDTKPIMTSQFTAVKCTNWKPQQAFLLHDIMKEEEQTCDVNSQAQLRQSLWEFAWHHTLEAMENAKFIFCCSFTEAAKPALHQDQKSTNQNFKLMLNASDEKKPSHFHRLLYALLDWNTSTTCTLLWVHSQLIICMQQNPLPSK